jgi:hypothetical protein
MQVPRPVLTSTISKIFPCYIIKDALYPSILGSQKNSNRTIFLRIAIPENIMAIPEKVHSDMVYSRIAILAILRIELLF